MTQNRSKPPGMTTQAHVLSYVATRLLMRKVADAYYAISSVQMDYFGDRDEKAQRIACIEAIARYAPQHAVAFGALYLFTENGEEVYGVLSKGEPGKYYRVRLDSEGRLISHHCPARVTCRHVKAAEDEFARRHGPEYLPVTLPLTNLTGAAMDAMVDEGAGVDYAEMFS